MSRPNLTTVRCEALFASSLRRSDPIAPDQVREAIAQTIRALGGRGCAAWVAQEYGDYPESAVTRMQWARSLVAQAYAGSEPVAEGATEVLPGVIAAA